jgi:excisionase family DNA binding protein
MASVTVEKAFCTTTEAAALLGISVGTVQLWVESGVLEAWKTSGGHRRVLRQSIDRLLRRPFEPAEKTEAELLTPGDPAKLNVLVVEDDPNLLRLYEANISRWPGKPEVMALRNAFTALIRIGSSKPDLLILDLQMPGIDGFNMLRVLNNAPEAQDIRIVVVSGLDAATIAERGGLPEGVELLPKPIPFDRLLEIAREVGQSLPFKTAD